jgi:CRISPR-associated endoribonuclease Cas6
MTPFTIGHYKFKFICKNTLNLPEYTGQTWRGGFGYALKKIACVTHEKQCQNCLLFKSCIYSYLFETPPPSNAQLMRLYQTIPHPFVIRPSGGGKLIKGSSLTIEFLLFGKSQQHLPYVVHAMKKFGENGIGKDLIPIELDTIEQNINNQWKTIYQQDFWQPIQSEKLTVAPLPRSLTFHINTPLRIKSQNHIIKAEEFSFSHLFKNVLRRISMISAFHQDNLLELDYKYLNELSEKVEIINKTLYWKELSRYSTRQKRRLHLDGVLGEFTINTSDITELWPYIWLGQSTHVGKSTSMGLGQYTLNQ